MKGLLLKDWYTTTSYFRFYLLLVAVFLIVPCFVDGAEFYFLLPCLFTSAIVVSLVSCEEKERWDIYAVTLPCSRAQIVSEKYVFTLTEAGIIAVLTLIFWYLAMAIRSSVELVELGRFAVRLVTLSLFPASVLLPFAYKYGAEKGRLVYYFAFGVIGAMAYITGQGVSSLVMWKYFDIMLLGASVLLFALSWLLSIKIYQKREL